MDLTESEIALIEIVLTEYDCGFLTSFEKFQNLSWLRFLYNNDSFAKCLTLENRADTPQRSLKWLVAQIQAVVRD